MRLGRALGAWSLVLLPCLSTACEPRELPVFDLSALVGGAAGVAGGGSSTAGGGAAGSAAGTTSGADTGGSAGTAGGGATSGGANAGGSAGSGGSAGEPPKTPCATPAECMPGWQCEKPSCDAVMGVCEPPPLVFCPPEPEPVCGCDGVTYWNDCVRRQAGTPLEANGECSVTACACEVDADCEPEFAYCAHLVQGGETCHDAGTGACWVLPPQCKPNDSDARVWQECRPPDLPPAPCVDTCLAIRSGHPHKRKKPDDQCQ